MTKNLSLKVTLTADGKQLSGSLKTASGQVHEFGATAQRASDVATTSFSKTRQGVESISKQLQDARSHLLTFVGVSKLLAGGGSVIQMADSYGEMAARIRMATTSTEDYRLVQQRLQETAGGTYRALSEAQELYIRTAGALRSLGYNTEQQLDITDSLSYAFVVNSTSADQASSAINAFSRSIQTGKVSSQDWQSLLMATPTLVDDIVRSTGKTAEQIRALGIEGKLGLAELTEGLRLARDENQRLADGMDTTVDDALMRLRNNFSTYLGELNQSHELTHALAGAVGLLAKNLEGVLSVALVAGAAASGRLALGLAATAAASAKSTLAARAAAAEELRLAKAQVASASTALNNARAQTGLTAGHGAAARAAEQHQAALSRLTAAKTAARAGSVGLLSVLTGPVGLAITAAAVAASFVDWGNSAKTAASDIDTLTASTEGLSAAAIRLRRIELTEALEKQEKAAAKAFMRYQDMQRQLDEGLIRTDGFRKKTAQLAVAHEKAAADADKLRAALQRLNETASQTDDAPVLKITGGNDAARDAARNIETIIERLQQQYMQLKLNEERYLRYQLVTAGASEAQIKQALAIHQATVKLKEQKEEQAKQLKLKEEATAKLKKAEQELKDWAKAIAAAADPARELEQEIAKLQEAWADGLFNEHNLDSAKFDAYVDGLKKKLAELNQVKIEDPAQKLGKAMQTAASGLRDVAGAMQGMHEQGTRGYQEMAVAMQAINVLSAVGAVLEQGKGDPYTAFARMAAMAAAVAALGVQINMMGGGFSDDAAKQQAVQGTGSVLGDATAKSKSISKAVDITAEATSQLVGINRDMLRALQAMQAGISGASTLIARETKGIEFGPLSVPTNVFDMVSSLELKAQKMLPDLNLINKMGLGLMGGISKTVGKLLGGSSKVTDQGVQILGGTLAELIEEVTLQAYQATKSKKYKWSSSKKKTEYQNIEGEAPKQFSLVFEALADSVYAGATALGMAGDEVEKAINDFNIATIKISTKGLTPDQQEKEIEAVFSKIFDDLAGAVVDFLPEFQKAGEGLGETLARVATSVQVTEEAILRLGFQAERLGAEQFAELSVAMVEAAGGLEQFISGMNAFVDAFASDALKHQLIVADVQRAFKQVGLSVPDTRDAMWDLMQSLDAGTQSGREQIAALLDLTKAADIYYKALEEQLALTTGWQQELTRLDMSPLERSLEDLRSWYDEQIRTAEKLGAETVFLEKLYARKRADALQAEYERISGIINSASASIADSILSIQRQSASWSETRYQGGIIRDLRDQLGSGSIEQQVGIITQLQGAITANYQAQIEENRHLQDAANQRYQADMQAYEALRNAALQLRDAADALLLSAASPELLGTQLSEAQRQFATLLQAAQNGDAEAASKLQTVGSSYLGIAKDYYAQGSDEYAAIFDEIQQAYRGVAAKAETVPAPVLRYQSQSLNYQGASAAALRQLRELQEMLVELEQQAAEEGANYLASSEERFAKMHEDALRSQREQIEATQESSDRVVAQLEQQVAELARQREQMQIQNAAVLDELARMRGELVRTQEINHQLLRVV